MLLREYVPPVLCNEKIFIRIYSTQQEKVDGINNDIQDLINQCFIDTATWSLSIWEEEYGLKTVIDDTYENRRNRIRARKRGTRTTTKEVIRGICNSFVDKTTITEYGPQYYFDLLLKSYSGFYNYLQDLMEIIEELKPAHLGVTYHLMAVTQSNIYIALTGFSGEIIKTYPWTPNDIESKLDYYVPTFQPSSLEKIKTYPKEAI
ncbi:hypothetical protein BJV38_002855 [Clostridium beijerinckii]|uniref:putative phage tail protein n=1 Tax=Clostridium beijerinckii TaxID=1520 RepID=UPI00156E0B07|nr:putative phage tail protein [Clostridium beijerinckii]NRT34558.1 hypothetical protein [Clostridium beijerinckii]NRT46012.1 hypothetical protein [Clostridium beijerinckii]NRZ19986.1 hypothetical protein [Clostridium beijerinckii]